VKFYHVRRIKMNIFEKPIDKEYIREYIYDRNDDLDEWDEDSDEWDEDFDELPDIIYQNDTVRISHLSGIKIVECVFLQDDINVYLTFICTDISGFSERFSNEALTAITQSDVDCVEKFDSICELIFQKKFDRTIEDINEYGLSLKCSMRSEVTRDTDANLQYECSNKEFGIDFGFYFNNIEAIICFIKEDIKAMRYNTKIIELANRIIPYEERFDNTFNGFMDYLNKTC